METLRFEAIGTFQVSAEALWPLLSDTPRLNRAIGFLPVEYEVRPAEGGGSHVEGRWTLLGFPIARWTEHPFRWEAARGYAVVREYHGGLLRRVLAGAQLTPEDGGTQVRIYGEILPRNALGAALVRWLVGPQSVNRTLEQCRRFEQYLLGRGPAPYPQLAGRRVLPASATETTDNLVREGLHQQAVEQLRRHLAEGSDEEVVKMRPFELADRWKLDRWEVLRLFLHATVAGLVVMSWDVLCPNCRVGKAEYFSLRDLKVEAHCDVCNIRFDASFDRSVEVRFTVAPALRRVPNRMYCIGGPQNTPHILAQTLVPASGAEQLTLQLEAGSYRLRSPRSRGGLLLEVRPPASDPITRPAAEGQAAPELDEAPLQRCQLTISAQAIEPSLVRVDPGPLQLTLSNVSQLDQLAMLEEATWPDTVATAAMVSSLQEFRDLFSSEVLAPGLQLGIETLAFMFTDLTGSTAMYQAVGQARAFRLVQDHFRILGTAISANRGALVKTIGDAVMATFPSGTDALAASLQIQRDIRGLQVPQEVDPARLVKVGLHQGPCLAVTLNDRLDYFGSTVNTAARIEHECRGGQIVASLAVCQTEQARRLLEQSGARLEEEVVQLRGLAEPVPVYRITPP